MTAAFPVSFAAWAARHPEAVACAAGTQTRTYRQIDARAWALAAALREAGVRDEDRVVVAPERTADLPAVLLGVARSGGVCVPVDPAHPIERVNLIVADAAAKVVVTDHAGDGGWDGRTVIGHRDLAPGLSPDRWQPPHPDSLSYLLYTSGSTGQPKGVAVTHGAVAACLDVTRRAIGFEAGASLLAVTPLTFDIAVLELMLPLVCGGSIVLASRQQARTGPELAGMITAARPRFLHATPLTWQLLRHAGWTGDRGLTVLIGGDRVPPVLAGELAGSTAAVHHLYGPTEATMYSVSDVVPPGPQPDVLPIGMPIEGSVAGVYDTRMQPVPDGTVGELCLGGVSLARGYVNAPALTAARFVPDPARPGRRLYRTGDLARVLPDGRLELRGRTDDQIKIRGHRVELGEVENALAGHTAVTAAAAVAGAGADGSPRIVAFVQLRDSVAASDRERVLDEIREHVRQRLPQHMCPAAYAVVRAMPTTTTGKIDRKVLAGVPLPER
ncbi:amino acid adenylation domain-containing protein [Paractinoplanes hotanensis]|uniref:Amino acid adenylation domain-containing protein n=1 Tax=Paractinoplanes hotanensis TaxID=2906497 RepID=A0ABT0YAP8_9ACTN|nr:amino acid adenylation domain-containing protein [Actinoplanes hotanensis]MCM4083116.1 amino acid adenylation domain-containing protein [Actinoplanes hotanensis]